MFQIHVAFLSLPDYVFFDSWMRPGSHVWSATWLRTSTSSSLCNPSATLHTKYGLSHAFTSCSWRTEVMCWSCICAVGRMRRLPRTHFSSLDHNAISARTTPPVCLNKPAILSFFRSFRFSHTFYVEQNWALTNTHQLALPRFL